MVYYCQGLNQSISPSSASDMAEISSARSTVYPPASCSASCFPDSPWRSTSTPTSSFGQTTCVPSQLCEEAPHLCEGGSMAARRSLSHLFNSFTTASCKSIIKNTQLRVLWCLQKKTRKCACAQKPSIRKHTHSSHLTGETHCSSIYYVIRH